MKIGLFLSTTFIIDEKSELYNKKSLTSNEKRTFQYIEGFKSLKLFKGDIFLLDNSADFEQLHPTLQKVIKYHPNLKYIHNTENKLGKINKTAGIIDVWKKNYKLMENYDYIIHFEPRQKLVDDSFFKNEGNTFYVDKTGVQFHTGLFKLESKDLIKFIRETNNDVVIKENQQLEKILFQFVNKNKIKFNRVPSLGLIWFDSYKNDEETFI